MCEHCRTEVLRSNQLDDELVAEQFSCEYADGEGGEPGCHHPALYEVHDVYVEGHCCEEHFRFDAENIGDDLENFLPIEAPDDRDRCDGGYSNTLDCSRVPTRARIAGGVTLFCREHAGAFGPDRDNGGEPPDLTSRIARN